MGTFSVIQKLFYIILSTRIRGCESHIFLSHMFVKFLRFVKSGPKGARLSPLIRCMGPFWGYVLLEFTGKNGEVMAHKKKRLDSFSLFTAVGHRN